MTIETEDYLTRTTMRRAKEIRTSIGWRSLHTDFINNDESQGYRVTYVNGSDDPDNSPEADQRRLEVQRQKLLRKKLEDNTISFVELKEFLRDKF